MKTFKGKRIAYHPRGSNVRSSDPTPDEIAALCQEVQATWTETERESRKWWTVERVDHRGSQKVYRQDAPLDWSLRRTLVAEIPAYELPVVPMGEVRVA